MKTSKILFFLMLPLFLVYGTCEEISDPVGPPVTEEALDDKVADVAGMRSFAPYLEGQDGFSFECNRAMEDTHEGDTEYKLPGGGWASNIQDLAKFTKGLINNDFIPLTGALWVEVPGNSIYRKGIFYEFDDGKLHVYHGGDNDDFNKEWNFLLDAGYYLVDLETYVDGTFRHWAGVWESAAGDERFRLDRDMCEVINQTQWL